MSTAQLTTPGLELEVSEPSGVVRRRKVSASRLDRAARELNLISVSAKGLLNVATIGRFLDQVGILQYGTGKLLASSEMISQAASRCAALADRSDIDEEIRQGYLDLQLRFVKAMDENIQLQMDVNNVAATKTAAPTAMPAKPFLVGAQVSPIQLTINTAAAVVTGGSDQRTLSQSAIREQSDGEQGKT